MKKLRWVSLAPWILGAFFVGCAVDHTPEGAPDDAASPRETNALRGPPLPIACVDAAVYACNPANQAAIYTYDAQKALADAGKKIEIFSAAQVKNLIDSTYYGIHAVLCADVDLQGQEMLDDIWDGIWLQDGSFDGNFHAIKNYYSERGELFSAVQFATVKNLRLQDAHVKHPYGALLARFVNHGTLDNVYVSGHRTVTYVDDTPDVGGVVAYAQGSSVIKNVTFVGGFSGDTAEGMKIGGIAASIFDHVKVDHARTEIDADVPSHTGFGSVLHLLCVGGIACEAEESQIQWSVATGSVDVHSQERTMRVGGLVGRHGFIKNSYADVAISAASLGQPSTLWQSGIGALAAYADGIESSYSKGTITTDSNSLNVTTGGLSAIDLSAVKDSFTVAAVQSSAGQAHAPAAIGSNATVNNVLYLKTPDDPACVSSAGCYGTPVDEPVMSSFALNAAVQNWTYGNRKWIKGARPQDNRIHGVGALPRCATTPAPIDVDER